MIGMWKPSWNTAPNASTIVVNRTMKPQKMKKCMSPGTVPLHELPLSEDHDELVLHLPAEVPGLRSSSWQAQEPTGRPTALRTRPSRPRIRTAMTSFSSTCGPFRGGGAAGNYDPRSIRAADPDETPCWGPPSGAVRPRSDDRQTIKLP